MIYTYAISLYFRSQIHTILATGILHTYRMVQNTQLSQREERDQKKRGEREKRWHI